MPSAIITPVTPPEPVLLEKKEKLGPTKSYVESLQTDEQRRVLDTVAQVRKCGLDSILSLPQLVVCGDQSAGKSSVLEALTEIPFPRNENLCTRFATEIILRRGLKDSLTIKVIPDSNRSVAEQSSIRAFKQTTTDLEDLESVMASAMKVMGIATEANSGVSQGSAAFARDVLSIEIEGPTRPQLTLVDIPGLIGTATGIVTDNDIDLVDQITDSYIKQPRTICLAVVSASSDYATQRILKKVLTVDPEGTRTLGIITKPDRIDGTATKMSFLELAQNQDPKVQFKLGWHVLKNRSPKEPNCTLEQRNASEAKWFHEDPVFKTLPGRVVGIESLRKRLSLLLFEHVKRELPQLREELEEELYDTHHHLKLMGRRRASPQECKEYLSQLSMNFHEVCKAAVNGHYEGAYFRKGSNQKFDLSTPQTLNRARAVIQFLNTEFAETIRVRGAKYAIMMDDEAKAGGGDVVLPTKTSRTDSPQPLTKAQAIKWVHRLLSQTRGKELPGNFNPLLIGELFWEQSSKWNSLASIHVDKVADMCYTFLRTVLEDKCPEDVQDRVWEVIKEDLKARRENANAELERIIDDLTNYPINYNHYYTDTINKRRQDRQNAQLEKCLQESTSNQVASGYSTPASLPVTNFRDVLGRFSKTTEADMEKVSCEEALDALHAIYKVFVKTFVANVTTQVIERHIVRGLETIFSPLTISRLSDNEALSIASEPLEMGLERAKLEDKIVKLKEGQEAFRSVMGLTVR